MGDYELYHADRKKHKYIKKIGKRYFYTQQEIQAYLEGKKNPVEFGKIKDYTNSKPDENGMPQGKTIGARMYYDKDKNGGYDKSIGVLAKDKKITLQTTNSDHTLDLSKPEKKIKKTQKQIRDVKEAVAEATGRRDVYWEAPKVTENGHTFYDDEASELRTGNIRKRKDVVKTNKDGEYTDAYTKNSNLYENRYTKEQNAKTRAHGRKKLKKMATRPIKSMQKQSAKGKKAISKFYKNNINPGVTVTYEEAKLK